MAKQRLEEKEFLNPEEAIRYWNFSRRKFYRYNDIYRIQMPNITPHD